MITNKEVRISVNKTLTRKLIYVVAALTLLAMLIPAMAVPVSAQGPVASLEMKLIDPLTGLPNGLDGGYNITNSQVLLTPQNFTPANWFYSEMAGSGVQFVGTPEATATVTGVWGEAVINATVSGNVTVSKDKKWGQIAYTTITSSNSSYVTWNEGTKDWSGSATITDTVIGVFKTKDGPNFNNPLQGAILEWYLFPANYSVNLSQEEWLDHLVGGQNVTGLMNRMNTAITGSTVNQVSFAPWTQGQSRRVTNVSGTTGQNSVTLYAKGEEAVKIVVIARYPGSPQIMLTPEYTNWGFYTTEMEVVPQVRWAGEKIVLEKNFGKSYTGKYVKFSMENQSIGALEGITGQSNQYNGTAVWTQVDANGFASVILVSSDAGVANVVAGLYESPETPYLLGNQHFFTVYFLKLESVVLGDVYGKRVGALAAHDSGVWTPPNPWDPAGANPDTTTQTLNVSQDALLRARVKGWFTSVNPSWRTARYVDPFNSSIDQAANAVGSLLLPAGRWILPDDWEYLAGPNWQVGRMHWDIMCNPDGTVTSITDELGAYQKGTPAKTISGSPVIGPFSPGLELMTPAGWKIPNPGYDTVNRVYGTNKLPIQTVVPDAVLNKWDAPMPPAKIIFQIQSGAAKAVAGYFKAAAKTDIYYLGTVDPVTGVVANKVYTNPFYKTFIPAHKAIPTFINNGGYDWDSFLASYGPYTFWTIINQNAYKPIVASADPAGHPTVAEVYSDNHGEAMIWLNGNWNLALTEWVSEGSAVDIPINSTVATTTIQATADYPYSRLHQAFQSNKDTKTFYWSGQILGTDTHTFPNGAFTATNDTRMVLSVGTWYKPSEVGTYPYQAAQSDSKMVFVWITDRDGYRKGVADAKVKWVLTNGLARIATTNGMISTYNSITGNITLVDGFLSGTNGQITDTTGYRLLGESNFKIPSSYEVDLFNKFWGPSPATNPANPGGTSSIRADVSRYLVAGIKVESLNGRNGQVNVNAYIYSDDFDLKFEQLTSNYVHYQTNLNFTTIDALDDSIRSGDANCDGVVNMGDVTAVERMILGYSGVTSNAIINADGTVDMGTVVKIERTILGLK